MPTSQEKHTPGPWSYRPQSLDDWGVIRDKGGNIVACARAGRLVPHQEMDRCRQDKTDPFGANGHLIAAAPELAETLSLVIMLFTEVMDQVGIDPEGTKLNISHNGKSLADVTFADILAKGIKLINRAEGRAGE